MANPALQAVAARQTLILTHYGRKSGKPYTVTIWFAVDGDKVYLPTASVTRQWVRNVRQTPKVEMSIGGVAFAGKARFLSKISERDDAMSRVLRKYWMFAPLILFGRLLTAVGVVNDDSGAFEVTGITAAAR